MLSLHRQPCISSLIEEVRVFCLLVNICHSFFNSEPSGSHKPKTGPGLHSIQISEALVIGKIWIGHCRTIGMKISVCLSRMKWLAKRRTAILSCSSLRGWWCVERGSSAGYHPTVLQALPVQVLCPPRSFGQKVERIISVADRRGEQLGGRLVYNLLVAIKIPRADESAMHAGMDGGVVDTT
jgi:hypothetical protein